LIKVMDGLATEQERQMAKKEVVGLKSLRGFMRPASAIPPGVVQRESGEERKESSKTEDATTVRTKPKVVIGRNAVPQQIAGQKRPRVMVVIDD
jgi:hypothetical protein